MPEVNVTFDGLAFLPISSIYIALNALIMLALAYLVVGARRANFKSGGKLEGPRDNRIRAHANNTEYVPMALLLMVALEFQGAEVWLLHGLGIVLTVSRVMHGYGRGSSDGASFGRFYGTLGTWIVFIVGALALLWYALFQG